MTLFLISHLELPTYIYFLRMLTKTLMCWEITLKLVIKGWNETASRQFQDTS